MCVCVCVCLLGVSLQKLDSEEAYVVYKMDRYQLLSWVQGQYVCVVLDHIPAEL